MSTPMPTPAPPPEPSEPGAPAFVWSLWLAGVAAGAALIGAYGPEIPVADDFGLIGPRTGEPPWGLEYLWVQANEHRLPLPKLLIMAASGLAGGDFRAGMALSLAALAVLAAGLVWAARATRGGGTRYTDAFFPLILLGPGHAANLLWSIQFAFVLPVALAGAFLILIAPRRGWPGLGTSALAATLLAALPLCTATGLALVPGLALWLWAAAAAHWRSGRPRGRARGVLIAAMTVPALALMALYLRGFRRPTSQALPTGPADALRTALQFLSMGFGTAPADLWPAPAPVVPAFLLVVAAGLGLTWARRPEERPRVTGLLAYFAAALSLAAGVGWGRSGAGAASGLAARYVTFAVPALLAVPLAAESYGGRAARRLVPMLAMALALALLWPNARDALAHGRDLAVHSSAFVHDLRAGVPMSLLMRRHGAFLLPEPDILADNLRALRRAGVRPFDALKDDPPPHVVPVTLPPTRVSLATWDDAAHTARVTAPDPWLTFELARPRFVRGIRLRYSHANPSGTDARFRLSWRRPGQSDDPVDQGAAIWCLPTGPGRSVTLWVCESVASFRIQPDNQPCDFHIDGLDLLVP